MKCKVCNRERDHINEVSVCMDCGYANHILKKMGVAGYYDDWHKLKTIDGIEYE